jgi:proteasome lid subunit RPN8/RPN11
MIQISKNIRKQITEQAERELPNEACGYLAGKEGRVLKAYPMRNVDQSPEHFSFDPAEQFKVIREARKEELKIVGNYHSHPSTPARPSEEDIRLANDPAISYVIISLAEKIPVIRSFQIRENQVEPEEITE